MSIRAARLTEHGAPLSVQDVELPALADGEVLVELSYAGVNPVDRYNAAGLVAADGPLPRTLGGEASGHVGGVPVVIAGGGLGTTRDGVFAESVVAPSQSVFEIPAGVDLRDAGAAGTVAMTAYRVVEIAEIGPDDRVLVLGGSGGVGQSVISYAVSKGAEVWGQTGSEAKAGAITAMGAKAAAICDAAGLAESVQGLAPTAVIDPLGGDFTAAALQTIVPHGRLVLFGTSAGAEATIQLQKLYRTQVRVLTFGGLIATPDERRAGVNGALAAMARGDLRISIGAELGLDEVNDAFRLLADRAVTGKVLLRLR